MTELIPPATPSAPTEPAASSLPDAATMTPQDRSDYINGLRKRVIENPDPTDDDYPTDEELRHGVACLRIVRAGASKAGAAKKAAATVVPLTLDDFA